MIRERRMIGLLQAAQANDPSLAGEMTKEEKEYYDHFVEWLNELRASMTPEQFAKLDIDIPYSYEDDDDDDE